MILLIINYIFLIQIIYFLNPSHNAFIMIIIIMLIDTVNKIFKLKYLLFQIHKNIV